MSTVFQVLTMLGSIGMFLYGMSLMSGGLQKMAGGKLRNFMASMTSTKFRQVFTGIVVTALVQSSTATTLMLVSFVNAGLLTLANAIGVIMGANIGTTVTAWIFALSFGGGSFSLGAIAVPLMFFAFICLSMKKKSWKNMGEFIMGFALLFLGLTTLKETSTVILASDAVKNFLRPLTDFGPYYYDAPMGSVLLFMVIGAAMTLMMQSSAATMALTMALVSLGVIPFYMAAAMVLGENIGTTITSNIAASVANESAKRTARAHMLFNLFGVAWVICLFPWFLRLIGRIVVLFGFPNPVLESFDDASPQTRELLVASLPFVVATLHTLFNLINTAILIWFVPVIEKIVIKMVPSKAGEEEVFKLKYIGGAMMGSAEIALREVKQEIIHFGEICVDNFAVVREAINENNTQGKAEDIRKILKKYEDQTDLMEYEIEQFLGDISKEDLDPATIGRIRCMYKIVGEMESLGDSGEAIGRMLGRTYSFDKNFDNVFLGKLNQMMDLVDGAFAAMMDNLHKHHFEMHEINNSYRAEERINKLRNELRDEHFQNIDNPDYNYSLGVFYMEIVTELEKIGDFIINISEALLEQNPEANQQ